MPVKSAPSLKSKALRWLSQREQSRAELRRKLLAHALRPRPDGPRRGALDRVAAPRGADGRTGEAAPPSDAELAAEVDELLDWLEANRFLSIERFVESRLHARAPRFGNLRIRRELAEHGVELDPASAAALVATELDRARLVHARKFADAPMSAAEAARRARFLQARGFSADAIRRVLKEAAGRDSAEA